MNYDELLNPTRRELNDSVQCPNCGHADVKTTVTEDAFTYGEGPSAVNLTATVPLRTCLKCGFQFLDAAAEDAQHEAVCRHLGVMTPSQMQALRRKYGLSRVSFAQITKLGEATIARWERGEFIQNAAYDQLLYLLTFEENFNRLRDRNDDRHRPHSSSSTNTSPPRLRVFRPTQADLEDARTFDLRPCRRGA